MWILFFFVIGVAGLIAGGFLVVVIASAIAAHIDQVQPTQELLSTEREIAFAILICIVAFAIGIGFIIIALVQKREKAEAKEAERLDEEDQE